MRSLKPIWQAITVGVIAGMRSAYAPALVSHILNNHKSKRLIHSPIKFVESDGFANTTKVFAAAELVGDKLPFTPARTMPGGVAARCVSGGLSAGALAKAKGDNIAVSALLGTAAAVASTYACYYLRKKLVQKTGIADPWFGAMEDLLVIGSGMAIARTA